VTHARIWSQSEICSRSTNSI